MNSALKARRAVRVLRALCMFRCAMRTHQIRRSELFKRLNDGLHAFGSPAIPEETFDKLMNGERVIKLNSHKSHLRSIVSDFERVFPDTIGVFSHRFWDVMGDPLGFQPSHRDFSLGQMYEPEGLDKGAPPDILMSDLFLAQRALRLGPLVHTFESNEMSGANLLTLRTIGPVEEEVALVLDGDPLDALSDLVALAIEALTLGREDRFELVCQAVQSRLVIIHESDWFHGIPIMRLRSTVQTRLQSATAHFNLGQQIVRDEIMKQRSWKTPPFGWPRRTWENTEDALVVGLQDFFAISDEYGFSDEEQIALLGLRGLVELASLRTLSFLPRYARVHAVRQDLTERLEHLANIHESLSRQFPDPSDRAGWFHRPQRSMDATRSRPIDRLMSGSAKELYLLTVFVLNQEGICVGYDSPRGPMMLRVEPSQEPR